MYTHTCPQGSLSTPDGVPPLTEYRGYGRPLEWESPLGSQLARNRNLVRTMKLHLTQTIETLVCIGLHPLWVVLSYQQNFNQNWVAWKERYSESRYWNHGMSLLPWSAWEWRLKKCGVIWIVVMVTVSTCIIAYLFFFRWQEKGAYLRRS